MPALVCKDELVDRANREVRGELRRMGHIKGNNPFQLASGRIGLTKGDQVVFTATDESLGAFKGEYGEITEIHDRHLKIRTQSGDEIDINTRKFNNLDHGYVKGETKFREEKGLHVSRDILESKQALLSSHREFLKANPDKTSLIITDTGHTAEELNRAAREQLKVLGVIHDSRKVSTLTRSIELGPGDRVVFTDSMENKGIEAFEGGRVSNVKGKNISVVKDDGNEVTFSYSEFSGLKHGYALPTGESTRITVDKSFGLHENSHIGREDFFIKASRGRDRSEIFTSREVLGLSVEGPGAGSGSGWKNLYDQDVKAAMMRSFEENNLSYSIPEVRVEEPQEQAQREREMEISYDLGLDYQF